MYTGRERLRAGSAWESLRRVRRWSFPRRYPLVQFPNVPLAVGLLGSVAAGASGGRTHSYALAASYLGIAAWSYEELTHGVNLFRRLLGLVFLALTAVRVAHALRS